MRHHLCARLRRHRIAARLATPLLAAPVLAGAALVPAAATARTIKLPEADPVVRFEVPDDWTVTPADGGLQLVSPDRTSIILAGMTKADKAGLTGWQRAAGRRMVDFGITFDAKATSPKDANAGPHAAAAGDGLVAPLVDPAAQPTVQAGELAPLSNVPSMALLGRTSDVSVAEIEAGEAGKADVSKPNVSKPGEDKAGAAQGSKPAAGAAGAAPADKAAAGKDRDKADGAEKPLHFASVVIRGAALAGKPVDVQFVNFGYSKDRWFLMQQESGPDDGRAGAIIKSVRAIR